MRKPLKIKPKYKLGDILYPIHHDTPQKYHVIEVKIERNFQGSLNDPNRREVFEPRIFVVKLDGSKCFVENFLQDSKDSSKWTPNYKRAWETMVTNKLKEAQEDYDYVMREIVNKKG